MGNSQRTKQAVTLPMAINRLRDLIVDEDALSFEKRSELLDLLTKVNWEYLGVLKLLGRVQEENLRLKQSVGLDTLTGLYNREAFERAVKAMLLHRAEDTWVALCVGDLRNFKQFNDQFGHQQGDEILKQVARALKHAQRRVDFLARWGGDEFCFFLMSLKSPKQGYEIVQRFKERVDSISVIDVGVVCVEPGYNVPYEELFTHADRIMYEAKRLQSREVQMERLVHSVPEN